MENKKSILLFEDIKDVAKNIKYSLEDDLGYKVDVIYEAKDLIRKTSEKKFDLIITDSLDGTNIVSVTKKSQVVSETSCNLNTPIIMLWSGNQKEKNVFYHVPETVSMNGGSISLYFEKAARKLNEKIATSKVNAIKLGIKEIEAYQMLKAEHEISNSFEVHR